MKTIQLQKARILDALPTFGRIKNYYTFLPITTVKTTIPTTYQENVQALPVQQKRSD